MPATVRDWRRRPKQGGKALFDVQMGGAGPWHESARRVAAMGWKERRQREVLREAPARIAQLEDMEEDDRQAGG